MLEHGMFWSAKLSVKSYLVASTSLSRGICVPIVKTRNEVPFTGPSYIYAPHYKVLLYISLESHDDDHDNHMVNMA
jgi:hypothetical protein